MSEIEPESHVSGLHEDIGLRPADIAHIIQEICAGRVEVEEKLDGQNFTFTVVNGGVRYAGKGSSQRRINEGCLSKGEMLEKMPEKVRNDFSQAYDAAQSFIDGLPSGVVSSAFNDGKTVLECSLISKRNPITIKYDENSLRMIRFSSPLGVHPEKDPANHILSSGLEREEGFSVRPKVRPVLARNLDIDLSGLSETSTLGTLYSLEIARNLNNKGMRRDHAILTADRLVKGSKVDHKEFKRIDGSGKLWAIVKELESIGAVRAQGVVKFERQLQKYTNAVLRCFDFQMPVQKGCTDEIVENFNRIMTAHSLGRIRVLRGDGETYEMNDQWIERFGTCIQRVDRSQPFLPTEGIVFRFAGKRYKMTGMFTAYHRITSLFNFDTRGERLVISQ
jgi:hypothetical protein